MTMKTGKEYIESLRKLHLNVYLFGEKVDSPVDHPIIIPSMNGAGSPQAQRVMIARMANLEHKKGLAKTIAKIRE